MKNLIAYDLGTGGIKASLFDEAGVSRAEAFIQYETYFPQEGWCEQRPDDWWDGVCKTTKLLLQKSGCAASDVACVALSGHSLVTAPIDKDGRLLTDRVPIWCDMRPTDMTEKFFAELPYEHWYSVTGNGDPPECYSALKLMWMRENQPEVYNGAAVFLGSKDYINYRLTGVACTDPSYASGFGVFDLLGWDYRDEFFKAAGIDRSKFPEIVPSDAVIGRVTPQAAALTGLAAGTPVACGGVDNTCMALGARGIVEGKAYTSLGSSSWIAVTSKQPIIDIATRPFVFAHAKKGYYTSAVSIFSAGNSFRWVRDTLCADMDERSAYDEMNILASESPVGSNGVLFNPTFAGGSAQEKSPWTHGGFAGLSLRTTRGDIIRASMEGVAMALECVLELLKTRTQFDADMLLCGGGSKSKLWRQMFADIYDMEIVKTNVDQDAASLGAAALAANAMGIWQGYDVIESFHKVEDVSRPIPENAERYKKLLTVYKAWSDMLADVGELMRDI